MKEKQSIVLPYVLAIILSFIFTIAALYMYHSYQNSDAQMRSYYYHSQVATLESPHGIRKAISKGEKDFILVDVRSQEEYELEHVVGALNVPVYKDPDTSAYDDVDRIVSSFSEIIAENPDRKIIIYCYSQSCMSGRKVGRMLAQHDIFVKELGIGWNEWRYDWKMWNYPHEWDTAFVEDYVVTGTEPGTFKAFDFEEEKGCSASEEFGC